MDECKDIFGLDKFYFVYEVYMGIWKKIYGGLCSFSYKEMADEMVVYVKEMGFIYVEFLLVMEYFYFLSWGY